MASAGVTVTLLRWPRRFSKRSDSKLVHTMKEKFRPYTGCFNPFGLSNHARKAQKHLRPVLPWMLTKVRKTELASVKGLRICDACRSKISKLPVGSECDHEVNIRDVSPVDEVSPSSSTSRNTIDSENESSELDRIEVVTKLNDSLVSLGVSPIAKRKIHQKSYHGKKVKKIQETLTSKVFHVDDEKMPEESDDIIRKLKEAYRSTSDRSRKILILTIFEDWPYSKIKKNFDATNHMIKVAKEVASEKGILSTPNLKIGRVLDEEIVLMLLNAREEALFSIAGHGGCLQIQKRLVLSNIKEAYYHFKEKHTVVKISFSKFAELRPKNCILAGASGTVCVCAIHGNVKLMIDGSKIPIITVDTAKPLKAYHSCLAEIICNPPSMECFFENCSKCPGPMHLAFY
ncbi:hypothetical protein J437_LFUL009992 [Ladona fulva]|uniref:Uncharacterized protein n=1 Tax=Ladona fulva TaxID=123851 RepID=A0A8K0P7A9_LADFU|nr:hypothetical protein J437_LFUL009992 [Ladona fulva]